MDRLDCDRMFVAVLERGSFAGAAERLGTSSGQGAFSYRRAASPAAGQRECAAHAIHTLSSRAALGGIPILLGAIVTVHASAGFFFTTPNGGWEFPALWIVGLVALALSGDGAWAVKPTPVAGSTRGLATANREEVL